jgi:hypothetical protein
MSDPLPDADLEQIEQRARRALDAAPAPWTSEMETRAPIGECSFIRFGNDSAIDQEMYLDANWRRAHDISRGPARRYRQVRRLCAGRCHAAHRGDQTASRIARPAHPHLPRGVRRASTGRGLVSGRASPDLRQTSRRILVVTERGRALRSQVEPICPAAASFATRLPAGAVFRDFASG